MNDLFALIGIEDLKPVLTALALPPVPLLVLVLIGARALSRQRGWGWLLVALGVAGVWLGACTGTSRWLEQAVLRVPAPLQLQRIQQLKVDGRHAAIVVLGGGVEDFAPEYGNGSLAWPSLERLRYGLWLSRQTGLPVAFSGGVGWAQEQGVAEAEVAARIAAQEFDRPLRWNETESRDTRQNAARSVALLQREGVTRIVLVTHGWHMPRAQRAFEAAAAPAGMQVEAAPMGLAQRLELPVLDWIPSTRGAQRTRDVLRELLGRIAGA